MCTEELESIPATRLIFRRVLKRYLGEVAALPVNYRLEFRMARMSSG